jgi:hypothetical protein
MKYLVVFLSLINIFVTGDEHLNSNGPFGKRHMIGDEPSPYACNGASSISLSQTLTVANINVSSRVYSSSEQIVINWTPISNPCVDDFVGIYFVDVDPSKGK